MADLDPIVQEIIAQASQYIEEMQKVAAETLAAAKAANTLLEEIRKEVGGLVTAARAAGNLSDAQAKAGATARGMASQLDNLRDAAAEASIAEAFLEYNINQASYALERGAVTTKAAMDALGGEIKDVAGDIAYLDAAIDRANAALDDMGNDALGAAGKMAVLGKVIHDVPPPDQGRTWRLWGTGIQFGVVALHAVIGGLIDFLAVLIPATVAAGAWAADWMQGAQNVSEHLNAVYTATEADSKMFHTTAGQAIGLSNALQKAQDAANPQVYRALGGGISLVKENFGGLASVGLRVGSIFDQFMGKVVYDMSAAGGAGARMNGLLSNMVPDLVQLGQIFGNLGHALLNFASDMPGFANVLLSIVDALSRLVYWFSTLPKWIIEGIFILHEFNTWGSVVVSMLGRLGFATEAVGGSFFGVGRAGGVFLNLFKFMAMIIPNIIGMLGYLVETLGSKLIPALAEAGLEIKAFGLGMSDALEEITPLKAGLITLAVAAVAFLAYKMFTMKTATQQWTASMQHAVQAANDFSVLSVIGNNINNLNRALAANADSMQRAGLATRIFTNLLSEGQSTGLFPFQHQIQNLATQTAGYSSQADKMARSNKLATGTFAFLTGGLNLLALGLNHLWSGYATTTAKTAALTSAMVQQTSDAANVVTGAQAIAKAYGISVPAAMALAQSAGVNLSHAVINQKGQWTALGEQVKNAVNGYKAMGQPMGAVGNDMLALSIQAGLQSTKVAQLNQAWDQFMQNLTGGTSDLANFVQGMGNITTVSATVSNNLSNSASSITLSTGQFANSLKHFSGTGVTAWQNFDQVVGSTAPQLIDWLRTAGAEGAVSGPQFQKGILDMVSSLVPLAEKSKTAQAELMGLVKSSGLNIKTFPDLVQAIKDAHASTGDLAKIVQEATEKMGNMGQVAQQLGTVMNSALTTAISNAALKASGFYNATAALTGALQKYGANSPQAVAAAQAVTKAWDKAQAMAGKVTRQAAAAQAAIDRMHGAHLWINVTGTFAWQGGPPPVGIDPGHYHSGMQSVNSASQAAGPMRAVHDTVSNAVMNIIGGGNTRSGEPVKWVTGAYPGYPMVPAGPRIPRIPGIFRNLYYGGELWSHPNPPPVFTRSGHHSTHHHNRGPVEIPGGPEVHVHVHGSVMGDMQQITRAVQTGLNQKTLRNGSTQAFIQGRKH